MLMLVVTCWCSPGLPSRRALAQAGLAPMPIWRAFDADGHPLAGGLLYTCQAGASCPGTPKATYTDGTGLVANTNPVVLNAEGYATVWLIGTYKFVLHNSAGVTQWVVDGITGTGGGGAGGGGSGLDFAYDALRSGTDCSQATLTAAASTAAAAGRALFLPATDATGAACVWEVSAPLTITPPLMMPTGALCGSRRGSP